MLTDDPAANAVVELAFMRWARAIRLPEKLRRVVMLCELGGLSYAEVAEAQTFMKRRI